MIDREEFRKLERRRRKLYEPFRYFVPHGGQEDFLALLATPGAYSVTAGAGNGWGKTEIIVAALAAIVWPALAPEYFTRHELFRSWPYPKRARINSTPAELQSIGALQVAIKNLFPKGRYSDRRARGKDYDSEWKTDTGWVIDTFSYEQDEEQAAGPTLGLQIWNEPPPEPLWREGQARLRRGGMNWAALTSLNKHPWVVDGLLNKHDGKTFFTRYGSSCENCRQHGRRGHLEHEQIERILSQFSADEREARFTGRPLSLSGRIFKGFDQAVHVVPACRPPEDSAIYQVVDPAIGKPLAVIYAYVDHAGQIIIFDEHPRDTFEGSPDDNLSVPDYAKVFKQLEFEHGRSPSVRILDTHFGNQRRTLGGPTLFEEFAAAGLDFQDSYLMPDDVEVETGIRKVKDYLAWNKDKPLDSLNRPRLRVATNCRNTITAFQNWARNSKTLRPLEQFKDFADCVRYLVMDEPQVAVKRTWRQPPQARYGVSNA